MSFARLLCLPRRTAERKIVNSGAEPRTTWWKGTVTNFKEALLTTMLTVYKMLNKNNTNFSRRLSGAGRVDVVEGELRGRPPVKKAARRAPGWESLFQCKRMVVPMEPQKACRAVRVYGKGKWMSTDLL